MRTTQADRDTLLFNATKQVDAPHVTAIVNDFAVKLLQDFDELVAENEKLKAAVDTGLDFIAQLKTQVRTLPGEVDSFEEQLLALKSDPEGTDPTIELRGTPV